VADYDNDGWPDIYVSNYGKNRLYHNNHDGTFTDVAEKSGVALGGWSTGATWGDYDRDGLLDLFVPGYVHYDLDHPILAGKGGVPEGACQYRGVNVFCGPLGLLGEGDHLFRNNGDGTFTDVSLKAGVADREGRYGFASVFADVDDDGWPDLIVANDSTPNYLYRNRRDGTFEDISYMSGFALNEEGRAQASMGIALGDYNHSGRLGLFITTFSDDYKTLYRAKFQEVPPATGSGLAAVVCGRGAAFGDLFNDGHIDVVLNNLDFTPTLIRNVVHNSNHWVTLKLIGQTLTSNSSSSAHSVAQGEPSRTASSSAVAADRGGRLSLPPRMPSHHSSSDAIGAKVFLTAGGVRQRADVFSGASYASTSDPRLHFGLG